MMTLSIITFVVLTFALFAFLVWKSPKAILYCMLLYWMFSATLCLGYIAENAGYPNESTSVLYKTEFRMVDIIIDEQASKAYLLVSFDEHALRPRLYVVTGGEYENVKKQLGQAKQQLQRNIPMVGKLSRGVNSDQSGGEPSLHPMPPDNRFHKAAA